MYYKNGGDDLENKKYLWNKEEERACFRLVNMSGIGNKSIFRLLDYTGSAVEILHLEEEKVRKLINKRAADNFLRQRCSMEDISLDKLKEDRQLNFVPFCSPQYPDRLRNINNPPFCLYVKGSLPKEHVPSVAIIGARACSEYGKRTAEFFGKSLGAAGIQVISGMARGIDGIAQRGAIQGGGETFAVLGCGADVCYPPDNIGLYRDIPGHGGIISEYPPGTKAQSGLFPERNRIISGLADLLLVIEARKRSGTYITVTQALEQGKDVYVVPGRITDALSEGCNYLLTQGAGVAVSPEVIVEALKGFVRNIADEGIQQPECGWNCDFKEVDKEECVQDTAANSVESIIMSCLDITPMDIDELIGRIGRIKPMDLPSLQLELTKLQIKGWVIGEGNYYRKRSAL